MPQDVVCLHLFPHTHQWSNQEEVPLHGGCVPRSELEQTTFPEKLVGRVNHFLPSNHLIDLQQPLQAFLQGKKDTVD